MAEPKHYRYGGNITHIGVEALPGGKDIVVIIDSISYVSGELINGKKQDAWICRFKKNPHFTLPMVLNATNRKRIAKLAGNDYLETVKDLTVTLTREMDRIPGESDKDWCLRVSKIKPNTQKPKLDAASQNFENIKAWVSQQADKGEAIKSIQKKYEVSNDVIKLLND